VHSLSRRLLISVSVPLALFFGVMMLVLDTGFRELSERSVQEVLDSEMVSLIAAAEPQPNGGYAPTPHELDPRLATPRSGVYAEIRSQRHQWRSPSTAGLDADFGPLLPRAERTLDYATFGHERVAIESRAIQFEDEPLREYASNYKNTLTVLSNTLKLKATAGPDGPPDGTEDVIKQNLKEARTDFDDITRYCAP